MVEDKQRLASTLCSRRTMANFVGRWKAAQFNGGAQYYNFYSLLVMRPRNDCSARFGGRFALDVAQWFDYANEGFAWRIFKEIWQKVLVLSTPVDCDCRVLCLPCSLYLSPQSLLSLFISGCGISTEDEKKERHRFISPCRRNRTHS